MFAALVNAGEPPESASLPSVEVASMASPGVTPLLGKYTETAAVVSKTPYGVLVTD